MRIEVELGRNIKGSRIVGEALTLESLSRLVYTLLRGSVKASPKFLLGR